MAAVSTFPVPDLSDARVMRAVAGIRPCRHGGLRLEAETLGTKTLIHNYGHGGCGITLGFGCAWAVADLLSETGEPTDRPVAVLGGGVIGLTTARELLRRGHRVRVYAERFATDTTSVIAGAQWLPTGIDFPQPGEARDRFNGLLRASAALFANLPDRKAWGVESLPVYEPLDATLHEEFFESGAVAPPVYLIDEPAPGRITRGRRYTTEFIHTPRFLRTLRYEVEQLGAEMVTRSFANLGDVESLPEHAIVNCLAFGAKTIFGDDAVYPARGVLVHVEPQPLGYIVHDEYRYMFPREDALVLGGTFEPGETSTEAPAETVQAILDHHRAFFSAD